MTRIAAIRENRSTHTEMSVMGSLVWVGVREELDGGSASMDISDISTKSRSRMRFTTLAGRAAARL